MFDNPGKELKRLEQQLLAAEQPDGKAPESLHPVSQSHETQAGRKHPRETPSEKKDASGGLAAVLLLELAVMMGVIVWWALWR